MSTEHPHRRIRRIEEILASTTLIVEQLALDNRETKAENDRRFAKWDADFARQKEENDRRFAKWDEDAAKRDAEAAKRDAEAAKRKEEWAAEMASMRREWQGSIKEMQKEWGRLANKMGTVVEDIVAPNMPRIAAESFGLPELPSLNQQRVRKLHPEDPSRLQEFDQILVYREAVVLVDVKVVFRPAYVRLFVRQGLPTFRSFFPEYNSLPLIPVFAAPSIPDNMLLELSRHHIYAASFADGTMELLNAGVFDWRQRREGA